MAPDELHRRHLDRLRERTESDRERREELALYGAAVLGMLLFVLLIGLFWPW